MSGGMGGMFQQSGRGPAGLGYGSSATGPANLWSGYSQTQYQQPRGQMMHHQGGGFGGGRPSWPSFGMGGMSGRYGGLTGYQPYGTWGNPFGFSGGYSPYGPGSYSSPGSMPFGGGSGMYGGGSYNMMANRMAAIPAQQMARSRFSQPYQPVEPPQYTPGTHGGMVGRVMDQLYQQNQNRTVMVPGVGQMSWGDYWG